MRGWCVSIAANILTQDQGIEYDNESTAQCYQYDGPCKSIDIDRSKYEDSDTIVNPHTLLL